MSPSPPDEKRRGSRPWDAIPAYFRTLWSGTEPLHRIVISDMLIGGTLINVVTLAVSLVLFGLEAPKWLGAAAFLSPIPYNVFLVLAVWRTAAASGSTFAWLARIIALVWILCMLVI